MAKLFCLLNNHNQKTEDKVIGTLNYNSGWQNKIYRDKSIFLGCFEFPFKKENDFWLDNADYVMMLDGEILSWRTTIEGEETMKKLLTLYRKKGEKLVHFVNGNFTLIVWDKNKKELSIMNDRMGLRPLYYSQYKNKTIFASEVKAIISDPDFDKQIGMHNVIDFFSYGYILEDRTFFEKITVFPYANTTRISSNDNDLIFKRYWDLDFENPPLTYKSENEYLSRFKEIISQAVERNMKGELRIGLPLSGGLDSRMIATMIDKKHYPLHTFTFGEKGCEDERYARRISKKLGTNHHYEEIKYSSLTDFIKKGVFYCDGLMSCNHYHVLNIVEEMKKYASIALDGLLGDTLPSGVVFTHSFNKGEDSLYAAFDVFGEGVRRKIFSGDIEKEIVRGKNRFLTLVQNAKTKSPRDPLRYLKLTQQERRWTNYGKIIMRNFLEARMPFCDYDFMNFCIALPLAFKKHKSLYREIFIKYFPEIASIPRQMEGIPLNASRINKAIHRRIARLKGRYGWAPKKTCNYGEWYRTFLKDFVCSLLLSRRFKSRKIFNSKEVEKILNEHFQRKANYEHQIGILLTFELFNNYFLD